MSSIWALAIIDCWLPEGRNGLYSAGSCHRPPRLWTIVMQDAVSFCDSQWFSFHLEGHVDTAILAGLYGAAIFKVSFSMPYATTILLTAGSQGVCRESKELEDTFWSLPVVKTWLANLCEWPFWWLPLSFCPCFRVNSPSSYSCWVPWNSHVNTTRGGKGVVVHACVQMTQIGVRSWPPCPQGLQIWSDHIGSL